MSKKNIESISYAIYVTQTRDEKPRQITKLITDEKGNILSDCAFSTIPLFLSAVKKKNPLNTIKVEWTQLFYQTRSGERKLKSTGKEYLYLLDPNREKPPRVTLYALL